MYYIAVKGFVRKVTKSLRPDADERAHSYIVLGAG